MFTTPPPVGVIAKGKTWSVRGDYYVIIIILTSGIRVPDVVDSESI